MDTLFIHRRQVRLLGPERRTETQPSIDLQEPFSSLPRGASTYSSLSFVLRQGQQLQALRKILQRLSERERERWDATEHHGSCGQGERLSVGGTASLCCRGSWCELKTCMTAWDWPHTPGEIVLSSCDFLHELDDAGPVFSYGELRCWTFSARYMELNGVFLIEIDVWAVRQSR